MRSRTRLGSLLSMCGMSLLFTVAQAQDWKRAESRDRSAEFVGFLQPDRLYWRPFTLPNVQAAEFKQLSFDDKTGARTLLVRLPPGWRQAPGYHTADLEMLVVAGGISIGDRAMGLYSYAYYPAGHAHSFSSEFGATVLQWWSSAPDYIQGATSRDGTPKDGVIDGVHYDDVPNGEPSSLPKFRDEPFMENSPIRTKLLRRDARTGQMTWIVTTPGGTPAMSGEGKLPLWASSASWQEGFLLAGDMTIAECLPPGQAAGTYAPNGYFFRPAGIRHGGLSLYSDTFSIWLFRTGPGHWLTYHDSCVEPSTPVSGGRAP